MIYLVWLKVLIGLKIFYEKLTRYYCLSLERDLFDWIVLKSYGRIGTRLGQSRSIAFDTQEEAQRYFDKEHKRRLKRGYKVTA